VDDGTIKPRQSSQVWNGTALFVGGLWCSYQIVRTFIIKAPFRAITFENVLMAGNALQQVGQGVFWVWKRFTEPVSRPLEPPAVVTNLIAKFSDPGKFGDSGVS
jgi:hypothetical protein